MTLPVRFFTETVPLEAGGTVDRELIETTTPHGSKAVRVVTDADRSEHAEQYAEFINAEVIPTYDELLAEWRLKHPKPTVADADAILAKRAAPEATPVADAPATPSVRGAR